MFLEIDGCRVGVKATTLDGRDFPGLAELVQVRSEYRLVFMPGGADGVTATSIHTGSVATATLTFDSAHGASHVTRWDGDVLLVARQFQVRISLRDGTPHDLKAPIPLPFDMTIQFSSNDPGHFEMPINFHTEDIQGSGFMVFAEASSTGVSHAVLEGCAKAIFDILFKPIMRIMKLVRRRH
jgi:hypothetical protein